MVTNPTKRAVWNPMRGRQAQGICLPLTLLIPPFQLESRHSMKSYFFQSVKRAMMASNSRWRTAYMSTQPFDPKATPQAGLVQIGTSIEEVIQQRLAEERARL